MRIVATLLTLALIAIGVVLLIPVLSAGVAFLVVFGGFFIWLLPILIIMVSDKTTGSEKLAWILAIVFLSWFAWIFYFLLAPVKQKSPSRTYRYE